ncbi:hypothetical protein GOP47_0025722 [Adiantum capillus-veneris]|uniref:Amino acid transporter transmembrane domain-containing protein n=1 Tax=Adiantum capillus-veneris TaxID=13818 RepID=A0A9D4U1S5_ADICA|nr:hypothetical protein GOP47_0025722 [Adiantum capillus-veneris]
MERQSSTGSSTVGGIMRAIPSLRRQLTHREHSVSVNPAYEQIENADDDGRPRRTGTFWTASAHIVTAVIGSGVLSLSWSMAKLGWLAGPLALLTFSVITYFTALLLADCYRTPSPTSATSKRNYTYVDAVRSSLGGRNTKFCAVIQYTILVGTAIGYTITASISMVAVARSNCFHMQGHNKSCYTSTYPYTLLFGGVQVLLSQIPTFSKLWWLSIVAAVMSFSYSSIGVGLGTAKAIADGGHIQGSLGGILKENDGIKLSHIWPVFQALGNIAFAYSYSMILIEIQDTIQSPSESRTMKKANLMGVSITTVFYLLCGGIGYAVFGDVAPGNLLTDFGFYEPYWLVDIANVCVVVHLVGAYQVFCQPLFAFVEEWISVTFPKTPLAHKHFSLLIASNGLTYRINIFRLIWRTSFVIFTTLAAMLLPFFNDILGILGALAFWPLTVYFPVEMHIANTKTARWSLKWLLLEVLSLFCLLISLAALAGSMEGVVKDLMKYKPFQKQS